MRCKIKLFLVLGVILFSTFAFTSCNLNYSSNNNIPGDSSSIMNSGSDLDDEMMYVGDIPQQFICLGNTYVEVENSELMPCDYMIGYLVNENELDYWQDFDKNNELIYALDTNNGVFRKTYEGEENLKNRYELYAQSEAYAYLAIKGFTNDFIFYQKQERIL